MKYSLSTLMFEPENLMKSLSFAHELKLTLEIFPLWHEPDFVRFMKEYSAELRGIISSFHEPYNFCEHSVPRGGKEHASAVDACRKTFEYAANLGAKHMVFHHNNCDFTLTKKADMIKHAKENLREMNEIAAEYGIPYLVENAGVIPLNNMLFNEEEFIALFAEIENDCVLDIGHAHCNGWNIARVMSSLDDRIKAYHIHNNDASSDTHQRIGVGTLDIAAFKHRCYELTPDANIIFEYVRGTDISIAELGEEIAGFKASG